MRLNFFNTQQISKTNCHLKFIVVVVVVAAAAAAAANRRVVWATNRPNMVAKTITLRGLASFAYLATICNMYRLTNGPLNSIRCDYFQEGHSSCEINSN